jgi:hypothetical protein
MLRTPRVGKTVSIRARIEDATLLWQNGRREGAFLVALVATAAVSRLRYPDSGDGEAFRRFVRESQPFTLSVEFRGKLVPVEQVLYKWMRCELVHEGGLPVDVELMPDSEPGVLSVRAGGEPERVLKLSEAWFEHLVGLVVGSPEYQLAVQGHTA